jgi:DNA-binding response OmpR family regulator
VSVLSILLVDDEVEFTTFLAKLLRKRGFAVTVANDGAGALAHIAAEAFDAVLLDVKMPGLDGIATLSSIKVTAPHLPVILLTGHLSATEERDGLRSGAVAYLLKPHPIDDLVARLEAAARGHRGGE